MLKLSKRARVTHLANARGSNRVLRGELGNRLADEVRKLIFYSLEDDHLARIKSGEEISLQVDVLIDVTFTRSHKINPFKHGLDRILGFFIRS